MTTLPDKPSALIRLAIADLEKCEASPDYVIDMDKWHQPNDGKCLVCLAGSVMGQTLGIEVDQYRVPSTTDFNDALCALDNIRCGFWSQACKFLDVDVPDDLIELDPELYQDDPAAFKADMLRAADIFEEAGL